MMTPRPPGVHDGVPEADYHRDSWALSSTGARLILPPSCPAIFHYRMVEHPDEDHRAVFEFGKAAHRTVLGIGPTIRYVDANDWRTKAAQQAAKRAQDAGEVALLEKQRGILEAMAAAIKSHPLAGPLFEDGRPEQSLYLRDSQTGVDMRGRLDWLRTPGSSGRYLIVDYKTADSADPETFGRAVMKHGYHQQGDWYRQLVIGLGLAEDPAFLHVVQEKTPPYLVSVVQMPADALRIGHRLNRQAIARYAECAESDRWPGYADNDVAIAPLPVWYTRQFEDIS
jgi:hypothetical protein